MDTPLTALRWLLASEDRCDGFLEEIERLNTKRKTTVSEWQQQAQEHIDTSKPVLIYTHPELEHGIIGLIAGKLTEIYHRPSIVLCPGSKHIAPDGNEVETLVASCRSPEWCDLIPLLDSCRDMFVRYGGHRQAAGFTLENAKLSLFSETINALLSQQHPDGHFPAPMMRVDAAIRPHQLSLETLDIIDSFRPFGIGNPRPVWLLEKVTISEYRSIGNQGNHLRIRIHEHPIVLVYWNGHAYGSPCSVGSTVSFLITLESHEWQ